MILNISQLVVCLSVDILGVVMMDEKTGVWLLHSVPKFPFKRDKDNFYPSSGAAKAQTFICVTFKYDQFNKIGNVLS